ncbi:MlaD family protein [Saccharopolyspora sp. SCSIO 74807]|uniref:MlaD family protein n=1 Tax=Saccharopolyspora sp. SCSIO 74807 TaxID=3118084 RepID=UPI0030D53E9F
MAKIRLFGRKDGRRSRMSAVRLGTVLIVCTLLAGAALFNKDAIITTLRPGETVQIHFARNYRLQPYFSKVKVSFVPVGVVSDVEEQPDGSAMVSVKIYPGVDRKLKSRPSAQIRPTTLLGGNYFIDLVPGGPPGTFSGTIPTERTGTPVELDKITRTLQPPALDGLRHSVGNLDETLRNGGRDSIDRLLVDAPGTLGPAGEVLDAARGHNPRTDLTGLVQGLETSAAELNRREGQLGSIVDGARDTGKVLGDHSEDLSTAVAGLPETLHSADNGLRRLDTSLGKLRDTADVARPVAGELDDALQELDPVLVKAEPFVSGLNEVLVDAQPAVQGLVPASSGLDATLSDLKGPVLDRINGPVKQFLLNDYKGEGPYANSNTDRPMYEEVAGAVTNLNKVSSHVDENGHTVAIQVGVGAGSVGRAPVNVEAVLDGLFQRLKQYEQGGR